MENEKDTLRDKLQGKQKTDEDRYIADREKQLLERLRQKKDAETGGKAVSCPRGHGAMVTIDFRGVKVEECPSCHGMWLERGELQTIAARERDSWLGAFLGRR